MKRRLLPDILRFVAVAAALAGLGMLGFALTHGQFDIALLYAISNSMAVVAVGVGVFGIADLIDTAAKSPRAETAATVSRIQYHLNDLQKRVDDIAVSADRLAKARPPSLESGLSPSNSQQTAEAVQQALSPALEILREIRDLSLLTDVERHERLITMEQERRQVLTRDAIDHIEQQRWSQADHVLMTLEREDASDSEVKRTRHYFEDRRRHAEVETVEKVKEQVDNLMQISAWDQAQQTCLKLVGDFPGNVLAQSMLTRVSRERDVFIETSVARLVDELRHDVDRRLWRRALMHLHHLIEKYPSHPKVVRVSEQLQTLRDNAEIEERQEMEVQIQELIRARDFSEAIQLSEELLRRFPNSPQAEAIEKLLPRIRDVAADETDVPVV